MSKSIEQTDWLGRKYTEHYDDDGNKTGESREEKDWLGREYTEHTGSPLKTTRSTSKTADSSCGDDNWEESRSSDPEDRSGESSYPSSGHNNSPSPDSGAGIAAFVVVAIVISLIALSANSKQQSYQPPYYIPPQMHAQPQGNPGLDRSSEPAAVATQLPPDPQSVNCLLPNGERILLPLPECRERDGNNPPDLAPLYSRPDDDGSFVRSSEPAAVATQLSADPRLVNCLLPNGERILLPLPECRERDGNIFSAE